MTARREPSNLDLLNAINQIREEQSDMGIRLGQLEQWKLIEEASRSAIEKYKAEEAQKAQQHSEASESKSKIEVMKQLGWVLGLIGAILTTYAVSKGIL